MLELRGPTPPSADFLVSARITLWAAIREDTMGNTPAGAAVRATLFAFYSGEENTGPFESIWVFSDFFQSAGLPFEVLEIAFRRYW